MNQRNCLPFLSFLFVACLMQPAAQAADTRLMNTDEACVQLSNQMLSGGTSGTPEIIQRLVQCLPDEQFYFDNGAARAALAYIGEPAVPALIKALDSSNSVLALTATTALGALGPKARSAVPALKALLTKTTANYRLPADAAQALGKIGEVDYLIGIIQGKEPGISYSLGAQGLGAAGPSAASAVPALLQMLNSTDGPTEMYAADALGQIGSAASPAIPRLTELSHSSLNFVQRSAGEALAKIGTPEAKAAGKPYQRRKALRDGFFKAMGIFVWHPLRALGVGIVFSVWGGFGIMRRPGKVISNGMLIVSSVLWVLYAWAEYDAMKSHANIRIDLLVIYPVLASVTLLSILIWTGSVLFPRKTTNSLE